MKPDNHAPGLLAQAGPLGSHAQSLSIAAADHFDSFICRRLRASVRHVDTGVQLQTLPQRLSCKWSKLRCLCLNSGNEPTSLYLCLALPKCGWSLIQLHMAGTGNGLMYYIFMCICCWHAVSPIMTCICHTSMDMHCNHSCAHSNTAMQRAGIHSPAKRAYSDVNGPVYSIQCLHSS